MYLAKASADVISYFCSVACFCSKASHEVHEVEAEEDHPRPSSDALKAKGKRLFWTIIGQIAIIDIVFSLRW